MTRSHLVLAAAVYGGALLLVAAWPTHVDEDVPVLDAPPSRWLVGQGLSAERTYWLIEWAANVGLFVPFGVLGMLAVKRATWIRVTAAALVVSGGIEVLQAVARPGRTADASDVAANVLGAAVGALGVTTWRRSARRRATEV
ncbi:VanZ family protein [Aeromicrobium sp. NPDC092404]|uniref:VanZ family protein n=1 Tax=Aeromicrobium sp. NPDC092404 TaxID=3154976 RepID=UPI003417A60C